MIPMNKWARNAWRTLKLFSRQPVLWVRGVLMAISILGRPSRFHDTAASLCHLEWQEASRIQAVLTKTVFTPTAAEKWLIVTSVPPVLDRQTDTMAQFTDTPPEAKATSMRDLSVFARPLLILEIPKSKSSASHALSLTLQYGATLWSKHLMFGPPAQTVQPLPGEQRAKYLRSTNMVDWDSKPFQVWLSSSGLRRRRDEFDILFAYRVLEALVASGTYLVTPVPLRTASEVSRTLISDCGGFSLLFVAILRANGSPARTLWGRWAVPEIQASTRLWHTKAEFFAAEVGWVPVDPSLAVMMRHPAAYFGQDQGDFLVLHEGSGLSFETPEFGLQMTGSQQSPFCWVSPAGRVNDALGDERWEVFVGNSPGTHQVMR